MEEEEEKEKEQEEDTSRRASSTHYKGHEGDLKKDVKRTDEVRSKVRSGS